MDTEAFERLVAAAGFIFRGSVEHHWKGEVPTIPKDAGETVAVRIDHVLRSTPVLRSLAGREAFVITRHAGELRQSHSSILFTECISLGQQLLLREIGQVEASDDASRQVAKAISAADQRPLRERVAAAELIVVGEVTESSPLDRPFPPRSEHDPLWSLARVAVSAVLKGHKPRDDTRRKPRDDTKGRKLREDIEVLYASSDDRVWFHSPKLHSGVSGILLLFPVKPDEVPKDVPRSAYQATDPLDFLPHERRGEVERLLSEEHGGR